MGKKRKREEEEEELAASIKRIKSEILTDTEEGVDGREREGLEEESEDLGHVVSRDRSFERKKHKRKKLKKSKYRLTTDLSEFDASNQTGENLPCDNHMMSHDVSLTSKKKRKKEDKKLNDSHTDENHTQSVIDDQVTLHETFEIKRKKKKHKKKKSHDRHMDEDIPSLEDKSEQSSCDDQVISNETFKIKRKKKKHKKRKSHDRHMDEDIPSLEDKSEQSSCDDQVTSHDASSRGMSDESHVTGFGPPSYHWKKRQLLVEGIEDVTVETSDEEDDLYSAIHEKFVTKEDEMAKLREEQYDWKIGRWSKEEIDILKKNVKSFIKKYSIEDISSYILDGRTNRKDNEYFFHYVARNIKRPLFAIYRKLSRTFNLENYVGKWTEDTDKELMRLYRRYGNKWIEIGKKLGVSGSACFDHYRLISKKKATGAWSEEETQRLREAMLELRGEDWEGGNCELPPAVTWEMVADRVQTRSYIQCWNKWVLLLSWKLEGGERQWSIRDDMKLIKRLSRLEDAEDEESVDWDELAEGWESARNRFYLRLKWSHLKRSVPNSLIKTFQECLSYLISHRVPAIKHEIKQRRH